MVKGHYSSILNLSYAMLRNYSQSHCTEPHPCLVRMRICMGAQSCDRPGREHPPPDCAELASKMATEVESLEKLLESAGQRALTEHELSEAKRILYGNPAQ